MDAISGVRKRRHCEGRIAAATPGGSRTCEHLRCDHLIALHESHAAHAPCCNRTMRRSDHRCDAGPCVRLPRERPKGESEVGVVIDVAVRVRLLVNAVVERLAFFAPRHGAFALTGTVGFCLFERTGLAPLIHARPTGTRSRLVLRGRRVRAPRDQGDAGNSGPIHAQASHDDCVLCRAAQCAGANFTMNATGRHATCGTWKGFAAACCRYKNDDGSSAMFTFNFNQRRQT